MAQTDSVCMPSEDGSLLVPMMPMLAAAKAKRRTANSESFVLSGYKCLVKGDIIKAHRAMLTVVIICTSYKTEGTGAEREVKMIAYLES